MLSKGRNKPTERKRNQDKSLLAFAPSYKTTYGVHRNKDKVAHNHTNLDDTYLHIQHCVEQRVLLHLLSLDQHHDQVDTSQWI